MSLVAGSTPRWVRLDENDNQIRLGDTMLFVLEQSAVEYRAMLKERTDSIHAERAALIQKANERISKLSNERRLTDDDKQAINKLKAGLERLQHPPDKDVAGHPSATLLTRFGGFDDTTSELSWWHDGVSYVLERRLKDGNDVRGLTSWLKRFEPGTPSLPDASPSLCLPNARLTLPADVDLVEGRIRFKLAATGDSTWVMAFSDSSVAPPMNTMHDARCTMIGCGRVDTSHTPVKVNPGCRDHRLRHRPPTPQSIAGRPGISVQLDGPACGLIRTAMLPVLGKNDPWNLAFGLSLPGSGEPAGTDLDAWRQALDSVRWGPLPAR